MRKRLYFFLMIFTIINIPTIIVNNDFSSEWGSCFWYVEDFIGSSYVADFVAKTVILIMPISILLSSLMTFEIVKYLKNNQTPRKKVIYFSFLLVIFLISFSNLLYFPGSGVWY